MENAELKQHNTDLLEQNNQLREQLDGVLGKLQDGQGTVDPTLVEEISIFQNKIGTHMPNKMLENIRKDLAENRGDQDEYEESKRGRNTALWSIAENSNTYSSTMKQDGPFDQDEYIKKLEHSVQWVEEKLQKSRNDFKVLKKENASLKVSNENHIFINEKLNKALKKSENRIEQLTAKIKTITNESVVLPKKHLPDAAEQEQPAARPQMGGAGAKNEIGEEDLDPFGGDMSSIMIKPDQIHEDNIGHD